MPSPEQLADLRRDVLVAFDGVERPPEPDIAPHECDECTAIRAAFARIDWRAMPIVVIEKHFDALPLFSPEAYTYFLGAWLLYALDHLTPDAHPTEYLVYDLAPNVPKADQDFLVEWRRQRLRHLTRDQLAVLDRFLDALEADPDCKRYFRDLSAGRAYYHESWDRRWES